MKLGGATGTTEADLIWNKYMFAFVAPEITNGGILIRLRNGSDENPAYYDRVVLKEAANFDKDELLVNGDFNINYGAGATTLVGSFQPHAGTPDMIVTQGDGVLHTGKNVIAIARVDVDEYDYANGKNYGYTFVVDFDYGGGGIPGLWVRARFADGTEVSQDVAFVRRNSTDPVPDNLDPKTQMDVILWVKQTITYDLTWITQSTTSPVVGIDIQLKGGGVEAKWDNASLRAVRGDIDLVDANGNEITGFITEEGVTIKPDISNFSTEDAGVTLWLCMYEVDKGGVTRLVNAVCGPINSELKFEGVSTVAGATVVKAIVLGSDMNYLLSETVK